WWWASSRSRRERGSLFFMGITLITIIYGPVGSGRGGAPQVGPGAWGGGGTAYPAGGRGFSGASGRSAPGAPPARRGSSVIGRQFRWNRCRVGPATWVPRRRPRGSPTFFEESRGKEHQGQAPGPRVYGPLALARSFWGSLSLVR